MGAERMHEIRHSATAAAIHSPRLIEPRQFCCFRRHFSRFIADVAEVHHHLWHAVQIHRLFVHGERLRRRALQECDAPVTVVAAVLLASEQRPQNQGLQRRMLRVFDSDASETLVVWWMQSAGDGRRERR